MKFSTRRTCECASCIQSPCIHSENRANVFVDKNDILHFANIFFLVKLFKIFLTKFWKNFLEKNEIVFYSKKWHLTLFTTSLTIHTFYVKSFVVRQWQNVHSFETMIAWLVPNTTITKKKTCSKKKKTKVKRMAVFSSLLSIF